MTPHFSIAELSASSTAKSLQIDNTPDEISLGNLKKLAENILEPLREAFGAPIVISSGFRSKALNDALKNASSTSQHMTGEAADMLPKPFQGESQRSANIRLFNIAKDLINAGKLNVGQLIDEFNYRWIHISLPRLNKPNNQILHLK